MPEELNVDTVDKYLHDMTLLYHAVSDFLINSIDYYTIILYYSII